jgi:hypothetical protein
MPYKSCLVPAAPPPSAAELLTVNCPPVIETASKLADDVPENVALDCRETYAPPSVVGSVAVPVCPKSPPVKLKASDVV